MRLLLALLFILSLSFPCSAAHTIEDLHWAFEGAYVEIEGAMTLFGVVEFKYLYTYRGFNLTTQGTYNLTFDTSVWTSIAGEWDNETEYYERDFNATPFIAPYNTTDLSIPLYDHLRHDEAVKRLKAELSETFNAQATAYESTRKLKGKSYAVTILEAHGTKGEGKVVLGKNTGLIFYVYLNDTSSGFRIYYELVDTNIEPASKSVEGSSLTIPLLLVIAAVALVALVIVLARRT